RESLADRVDGRFLSVQARGAALDRARATAFRNGRRPFPRRGGPRRLRAVPVDRPDRQRRVSPVEPLFLTYIAVPLGYAGVVVGLSSWGTVLLDRGRVHSAIRLFKLGAKAPLLGTQNLISRSNLM